SSPTPHAAAGIGSAPWQATGPRSGDSCRRSRWPQDRDAALPEGGGSALVLRSGGSGDAGKAVPRGLDPVGAMLLVDGDFGAGTSNAVLNARLQLNAPGPADADDDLQGAVAAVPDPIPPLTASGMTFIAREEVSDATVYQRRFQMPTCPPPPSG